LPVGTSVGAAEVLGTRTDGFCAARADADAATRAIDIRKLCIPVIA
jgi:hypothetical protein